MDGRRRLAEPVTDRSRLRAKSGAAPASTVARARARISLARARFGRTLRRWLAPLWNLHIPRGAGVAAALALMVASVAFGSVRGDHLPALAAELRDLRDGVANALGFRITTIALVGHRQLTREEILTTAGVTGRTSLLFLDAAAARARLKANPWIAEATLLKLYPGRLQIAVTERKALALWQLNGKVTVIAGDGTVLEPTVSKHFTGLPLVVGAGAETRAEEFLALLDKFPSVREQMRAAVLVAERRWNVMLNNGIEVRLPETEAGRALTTLVQLDRNKKLFSRDIAVVDLRLPDRVTVRLSDDAFAARQEAIKDWLKPKKKAGAA
jgi:cell division protein FtsQ